MAKQPWFPFYTDDWLSDEKLRACSLSARGLWTDILCLMHKNDRRGFLQLNGKPVTAEQLARMTGCSTDEVSRSLAELKNAGVPSVSDNEVIYSRRMTRDEKTRQARSQAGQASGEKRARTAKAADDTKRKEDQSNKTRTKLEQNSNKIEAPEPEPEPESKKDNKDPPNPPEGGGQCVLFSQGGFDSRTDRARKPTLAELQLAWNESAAKVGWKKSLTVEGKRLRAFNARCRSPFWVQNWRDGLVKAMSIPWLRGRNSSGWVMDLEWFLRPDSLTRILEETGESSVKHNPRSAFDDAFDRMVKEKLCKDTTNGHDATPGSSA